MSINSYSEPSVKGPPASYYSWTVLGLASLFLCARVSSAEPPRIAVITELSGPNASVGAECRAGAEVAARYIATGQTKVELVYGDSQDEVKVAVSEFNRLTTDPRVTAVVVSRSKTAIPLDPLSARNGIALIATAAHPALLSGNPLALRAYVNARKEGQFLAQHALFRGLNRIACITVEDEWNQSLSEAFRAEVNRLGGQIVAEENIQPSVVDLRSFVERLRTTAPDAVFVNLQVAQAGPFIRRLRESGIQARILSNYWVQKDDVVNVAGIDAVEGALFGEIERTAPTYQARFEQDFSMLHSTAASYVCYVAVAGAIEALRSVSPHTTREAVADAVRGLSRVSLLDGALAVNDREIEFPLRLYEIHKGVRVAR